MLKKSGLSINEAFEKACIDNDIIYHRSDDNAEIDPITLVDREGNSFKMSQDLAVIDLPSEDSIVKEQSIDRFNTAVKKVQHSIARFHPLNVKTKDGTDIVLVALEPRLNNPIYKNYTVGDTVYAVPYFSTGNNGAVIEAADQFSGESSDIAPDQSIAETKPRNIKSQAKSNNTLHKRTQSRKNK
ncbi:hypothetical protein [Anaerocolumna sp. MB42-C2]|uniref:hypothetical protein n=1 Tax=Anaerocolumna sp. MB42-C2 TaxID=3070997 RepID=UPI0027E1DE96|nr:hypothetical protein [Anaerocolumna sp. MB42-C2]WMJ85866.1 hypothetical protein RBU59_17565 [Anaerocolumna sp. MB42-C2]